MKRSASILIFCNSRAQIRDTIKEFSITTDVAQYILYQPNIGIGFRWNGSVIEINAAKIYPGQLYSDNPFANGQYSFPGLVYQGEAFRVNYKHFIRNHPKRYISAQAMYKHEWFNNVNFTDAYNGDNSLEYTMNEKTNVVGLDISEGIIIGKNSWYHLDFSVGLGLHDRLRNFDVTSVTNLTAGPGLGNYNGYIWYVTPVFSFKAGFNSPKFK